MDHEQHHEIPSTPAEADAEPRISDVSFDYDSDELEDMLLDTMDRMQGRPTNIKGSGGGGGGDGDVGYLNQGDTNDVMDNKNDRSLRMSFGCWTPQDKVNWTCAACTFVNEALHLTCTVCEKAKGHSDAEAATAAAAAAAGSNNNSTTSFHQSLGSTNDTSTTVASSFATSHSNSHSDNGTMVNGQGDEEFDPFLEQLRKERQAEVLELQESILSQAAMEMSLRSMDNSSATKQTAVYSISHSHKSNGNHGRPTARSACPVPPMMTGPASYASMRATSPRPLPSVQQPMLSDRSYASTTSSRRQASSSQQSASPTRARPFATAAMPSLSASFNDDSTAVFDMSDQEAKEMRKILAMQAEATSSSSSQTYNNNTAAKAPPTNNSMTSSSLPKAPPDTTRRLTSSSISRLSSPTPPKKATSTQQHDLIRSIRMMPIPPVRQPARLKSDDGNHSNTKDECLDPDILLKIAARGHDHYDDSNTTSNDNGNNKNGNQQQQRDVQHPGAYQKKPGAQAVRNTGQSYSTTGKKAPPSPKRARSTIPILRPLPPAPTVVTAGNRKPTTTNNAYTDSGGSQMDADIMEKIASASRESTTSHYTSSTAATSSAPKHTTTPGAYRSSPGAEAERNAPTSQQRLKNAPSVSSAARPTATAATGSTNGNTTLTATVARSTVPCVTPTICSGEQVANNSPTRSTSSSNTSTSAQNNTKLFMRGLSPPRKGLLSGSSRTETTGTHVNGSSPNRARDKVKHAARDLLKISLPFRKSKN